ncbi:acyl-CoA-like ligand-binding transcription factor [Nocardia thraciensis]
MVFGDRTEIVESGLRVLSEPEPGETPADLVLRSFGAMLATEQRDDPIEELGSSRARLLFTVPSLYGAMLQRTFATQERMAATLRRSYPEDLDDIRAAIVVGAFVGAGMAAIRAAAAGGEPLKPALLAAVRLVADNFG